MRILGLGQIAGVRADLSHGGLMHTVATCIETGEWPGYGDELHNQDLPRWYREAHSENVQ